MGRKKKKEKKCRVKCKPRVRSFSARLGRRWFPLPLPYAIGGASFASVHWPMIYIFSLPVCSLGDSSSIGSGWESGLTSGPGSSSVRFGLGIGVGFESRFGFGFGSVRFGSGVECTRA